MEHQFRRGIYRPNAQRLSISLAPLVSQRSMMFRVQTDLATMASYAEVNSAAEYSPALHSFSASAQIVTAVLTAISVMVSSAMSSASVYSQDSWKATESPFIPLVKVDPRRMAMAFSPSVQWSDMATGKRSAAKSPSMYFPFIIPQSDVLFSEVKEDNDIKIHSEHNVVPVLASNVVLSIGSSSPVEKRDTKVKSKSKKTGGPERSKSSKAFRKVMARLSFQPSKRELAQTRRADAVAMSNDLLSMDFKLPEFRVSPIRFSFIARTHVNPSLPRMLSDSPLDTLVEEGVRQRHITMPPPVTSSEKKGRRQVQSSVAAPSSFRRGDKNNIPPMPAV